MAEMTSCSIVATTSSVKECANPHLGSIIFSYSRKIFARDPTYPLCLSAIVD